MGYSLAFAVDGQIGLYYTSLFLTVIYVWHAYTKKLFLRIIGGVWKWIMTIKNY